MRTVGGWLCLGGAVIGALGLVGWFEGLPALARLLPGQPPIIPNVALGLLLAGGAGILLREKNVGRNSRVAAILAGAIVLAIGLIALAEYGVDIDLGVHRLLVVEGGGAHLGRPWIITAIALVLLGLAILTFDSRRTA